MSASRQEGFESDALYPRKLAIVRGRHLDWKCDGYVSKRCVVRDRLVMMTIKEGSHFEEVITQCDVGRPAQHRLARSDPRD
jgi:hypothetical protein